MWKPFDLTSSGQEMVGNLLNVPLFAGPCPNPDEVFVYKGPSTEMHDEQLARLAPGMIQFRVLLQEQVSGKFLFSFYKHIYKLYRWTHYLGLLTALL